MAADSVDIQQQYGATAQQLISAALADSDGMHRLQYLCDRIGNRLSGSAALELAIEWSANEMRQAGLENVQTPPVKVPHWVRGKESAVMLAPVEKPLTMIGLGMSVATPPEGITAELVAVHNYDQLAALGQQKVAGKIVLLNPHWEGYGKTVTYRVDGPSRAGVLGAAAVLVRSMTAVSLETPHTGTTEYASGQPKVPAAAVSLEDADMIQRLLDGGTPVRVRLKMEAQLGELADSHNVMGEIRGREKPEEVVVLGGHIDSWDIGQGANDDGSGIMAAFEAVALIKKLGLKPRRTIRVVFWVNEENGGAGGVAYRAMLGNEIRNQVAAIEMDGGAEKPVGFGFGNGQRERVRAGQPAGESHEQQVSPAAFQKVVEIGKLLASIDGGAISHGGGGSDIAPLLAEGVPGFGVRTTDAHYFDWHHTDADSFDKIVPREFQENVASLAVMSYVLADMPERLSEIK
jgi:hypothetical protein